MRRYARYNNAHEKNNSLAGRNCDANLFIPDKQPVRMRPLGTLFISAHVLFGFDTRRFAYFSL